jgi:hypothetical protein
MAVILFFIFGYIALLRSNAKHASYCADIDRQSAIDAELHRQKIAEIDARLKQNEIDFAWLTPPVTK